MGLPLQFQSPPTYWNCEGPYVLYIDEGRLGDVSVDGFWVCIAQAFPGAFHEGQGTCQFIINARVDERQREDLLTLSNRDVGRVFEISPKSPTPCWNPYMEILKARSRAWKLGERFLDI